MEWFFYYSLLFSEYLKYLSIQNIETSELGGFYLTELIPDQELRKACDRRLFLNLFPSGSVRAIRTNHLVISLITLEKGGVIPIWQILKIKVKEIY